MWEWLIKIGARIRNPWGSEDHLPCYINRATVTNDFITVKLIREYIEMCKKEKGDGSYRQISTLLFSVTEKDEYFKKWLSVAQKDGHVIIEASSIHGDYKCWAIIVQNNLFTRMNRFR
jgi:hypothetical protein